MPTISMFYGIIIRMYYDDQNPPHFHAFYNEFEATLTFDGKILDGAFPKNQLKLIEAWCIIHTKELEANWILVKGCEKPYNINPLK